MIGSDEKDTLHYFDLYQLKRRSNVVSKLLTKVEAERDLERSKRVELENDSVLKSKLKAKASIRK